MKGKFFTQARMSLVVLCCVGCASVGASGPQGFADYDGTVKEAAGIPREFFALQRQIVESRRADWLAMAEKAKPKLFEHVVDPVRLVSPQEDPKAFLGWRFADAGDPKAVFRRPLKPGDSFYFDFGEHLTGRFSFRLGRFARYVDAPPRLNFVFGEIPAETILPCPKKGNLSWSWHQDETVSVDLVPSETEIPRRLSFRYVKVTVEASSPFSDFCLENLKMKAVTSADESRLLPFRGSPEDAAIDRVANATLRECMQTVLEDGPKRDRRLWLGDLRLQALVNYLTYRNYDVVKRSILLLAGTCGTNGLVSTAAYEIPVPETCHSKILDFTAHFPNVVLEYLEASGDRATCESLWPLVLAQSDFTLEVVDANGLVRTDTPWWQFIDWQPAMTRQAAEQGVIVNSLRATETLGRRLGHDADVAFVPAVVERMTAAARTRLWDERRGIWVSDKDNVSWMSQAWMALSGIPTAEEARRSLKAVMADPAAVRPVTPYAHHYFTEALFHCGLNEEGLRHVREYWGGMVKLGADTYWEAWVPDDWEKSPYGNVLLNSFCHAFSSTPGYLLRKYACACDGGLTAPVASPGTVSDADRKGFGPLAPSAAPCERQYIWPEGKMPYDQPHQVAEKSGVVDAKGFEPSKHRRPFIEWFMPVESNRTDTCVLFVSGGGFSMCCDAERLQPAIDRFVRAGITVANVTYRTPRPKGLPIHQSAWADVQRAMRVIRSEAGRRGFSPDLIGATGISAGAKAVLLLALSSQTRAYERIDEIDDMPCNLNFAIPQAPAYVLDDGAAGPNVRRGVGASVVPELKFDEKTCPLCLLQGGTDEYSPLGSVRLYQRLRQKGIDAELHLFADRWHGFHGDANRKADGTAWDHWCDRMLEFVGRFDGKIRPERWTWRLPPQSKEGLVGLAKRADAYAPVLACGSEDPALQSKMAEEWVSHWLRGEQCDLHLEADLMSDTEKASRIREFLNHRKDSWALSIVGKIAARHKVKATDAWYGGRRIVFDFEGYDAWVVEPPEGVAAAKGRPWTWTMQWRDFCVSRTGVPQLLQSGYHHVSIDTFKDRMDEKGLAVSRRFQEFLVHELGFAPKACLIGMSWGGFFSVRYAAHNPQNVAKIYLDCPFLNLGGCCNPVDIGPWQVPASGSWDDDPRMPVNMAKSLADAHIPILLAYGGADNVLDPKRNSETFIPRFKDAGGDIRVVYRAAYGHHPSGFEADDPTIPRFFAEKAERQ